MKHTFLVMLAVLTVSQAAFAAEKVLVILSAENKVTLQDGSEHPTGFFLSETIVPLQHVLAEGYEAVFATPGAKTPTMDKISDDPMWFGGDAKKHADAKKQLMDMESFQKPIALSEASAHPESYAALIVPGGHAPMEDLLVDKDVGKLLREFHAKQKPTALICHGPIALLSALANPEAFVALLTAGISPKNSKELGELTRDWIYAGYEMTAFSTKEEEQEEAEGDNVLKGYMRFYPDEAIGYAGGNALVNAVKWRSRVVVDRELITGQNPFSDHAFGKALVAALKKTAPTTKK
jgi:putative intracellular protease/amidase